MVHDRAKNIVIGFDGTGLEEKDNSNVYRFLQAVDVPENSCIYIPGPGSAPLWHVRGNIGGAGIWRQIRSALKQIASCWEHPLHKIYLVGFSRGGAAAIILSNVLHNLGIHEEMQNEEILDEAEEVLNVRGGYAALEQANFRRTHKTIRPRIPFVGVFDPVGAYGMGIPRGLARLWFGTLNFRISPRVEQYCSLLAIDEHRKPFRPVMQDRQQNAIMHQIWLPGCHGDIGGGEQQSIAPYAFEHMITSAQNAGLPLDYTHVYPPFRDMQPTDSRSGIYRLIGKVNRPVGAGFPGEQLSLFASHRLEQGLCPATPPWKGAEALRHTAGRYEAAIPPTAVF